MIAGMSQPQAERTPIAARPMLILGSAAPLIFAAAVTLSCGTGPAARHSDLSSPYVYTIGDDIARRMQGIFRVTAGLEEATLVYYDRESHNVVAEIIGGTDKVDGAEREIGAFVEAIHEGVVGYAKKQHKIDLTDEDVTLIYYVDSDEGAPVEVVRRVNGQFVVPKNEEIASD